MYQRIASIILLFALLETGISIGYKTLVFGQFQDFYGPASVAGLLVLKVIALAASLHLANQTKEYHPTYFKSALIAFTILCVSFVLIFVHQIANMGATVSFQMRGSQVPTSLLGNLIVALITALFFRKKGKARNMDDILDQD